MAKNAADSNMSVDIIENEHTMKRIGKFLLLCGIAATLAVGYFISTGRLTITVQYADDFNVATVSSSDVTTLMNESTSSIYDNNASKMIIKTPFEPKFSWLMSYPNSGTSYTLRMTAMVSQRMMASNYGKEHLGKDGTTPMFWDEKYSSGPYPKHTEFVMPEGYLLTKTHCGGKCTSCSPSTYVETASSFKRKCAKSNRIAKENGDKVVEEEDVYDTGLIGKAVHLFRNPFDNIVSRFHLHTRHAEIKGDKEWLETHPYNATGFQSWCMDMNRLHKNEDRVFYADVKNLKTVPCYPEFYRYIQFHNLAFRAVETLGIPLHVMHYEDYDDDFNGTVSDLMEFLELKIRGEAPGFYSKDYSDHYSSHQRQVALDMMKQYASERTWSELKHRYQF